jgi:hypothetical protein
MTTRTAREAQHRCPLCERRVKRDRAGRAFSVHAVRPDSHLLLTTPAKLAMMTESDCRYLRGTGRCPFERGQRAA